MKEDTESFLHPRNAWTVIAERIAIQLAEERATKALSVKICAKCKIIHIKRIPCVVAQALADKNPVLLGYMNDCAPGYDKLCPEYFCLSHLDKRMENM